MRKKEWRLLKKEVNYAPTHSRVQFHLQVISGRFFIFLCMSRNDVSEGSNDVFASSPPNPETPNEIKYLEEWGFVLALFRSSLKDYGFRGKPSC